jgi:acetyl esterase/lipase
MTLAYDPANRFEVEVRDLEFRRTRTRTLLARVYRPLGPGPFPVLLDLHGGAWNNKDRTANAPMDEAVARTGVLVVAVDLTLAPEAPYPASVQDAHYAVRWLKQRAPEWNGDPEALGLLGSSSGGHVAQLVAMRPHDPRYGAIPLDSSAGTDASVAYVATRSPISDPYARYLQAQKMGREEMMQTSRTYFDPWELVHEGNPQAILDRREPVRLPPMLILQGGADDNVLPALQERFAASYRAAGGECQLEIFEGCEHEWVAHPGPQTERAHRSVQAFIARQLRALRRAA